MHFDTFNALALAAFAAATLDVKAETSKFVSANFGFARFGVQRADEIKNPRVGRGVGSRRAADGGLIDFNHLIQVLNAVDFAVRAGTLLGIVELFFDGFKNNFIDERGLA